MYINKNYINKKKTILNNKKMEIYNNLYSKLKIVKIK